MRASNGVGRRVRERRDALGLSQREASSPGVSYAYISRIEAGARRPSVKALRLLAPKLGVSVHWLETGEPDPIALLEEAIRVLMARDVVSVEDWESALAKAERNLNPEEEETDG